VGDRHVTMTELAQRLELTLPAVSNWRRRHESFPSPVEADGRELFSVDEVADWLDGRKVSKNNLKPDELPGVTYGARFRKAIGLRHAFDDTGNRLWQELTTFRGAEDVADFADLVLGLLFLAASNDRHWDDIVAADGSRMLQLVELAALSHEPPLLDLHRAVRRALLVDGRGEPRLTGVIRLVELVRQSGHGDMVFEFLLDRFAAEEGRRGAVVHTPPAVVHVLVELVAPKPTSRVLDPCCGSGGFLLGVAKYIASHGGRPDGPFTGHAVSDRSASLARMNLRLHGVAADVDAAANVVLLSDEAGNPDERFDIVLSNPPFDQKVPTWSGYTIHTWHPAGRINFMWLRHVISVLAEGGRAAVVMPGGTLFREGVEQKIRAGIVDDGVVEAIIALPPQLFSSTAVPVTVWLLSRSPRQRTGEILLVDASSLGHMISRTQRGLFDEDRKRIVDTVSSWRRADGYEDVRGFSASVPVEHLREQDYVLTPARYVGSTVVVDAPSQSVSELRHELARLEYRAGEVNVVVERQLDRIQTWIR
jgi:type I restriction enzyme M protein